MTVGDFAAPWWIAGVVMHGIWQWCFVIVYFLFLCSFCCEIDEDDDDFDEDEDEEGGIKCCKWMRYVINSFMFFLFGIVILGCLGFIVLFVGNMTYWNDKTFVNLSNMEIRNGAYDDEVMVLQIIVALVVVVCL